MRAFIGSVHPVPPMVAAILCEESRAITPLATAVALAAMLLAPASPAAPSTTAAPASAEAAAAPAAQRRMVQLDDLLSLRDVEDPQISPDGEWVAYTVRTANVEKDRNNTDVWMTRWDGSRSVRLTTSDSGEDTPRWSPDGQYLAFLSDRGEEEDSDQLWLLSRLGGEAEKLTHLKGEISDFAWSPDSRRLALIVQDPEPEPEAADKEKAKTPKPIVIDRYQFKQDEDEYLGKQREHLVLFDVRERKETALTSGATDEALPAWSPDGKSIAFVSKGGADPDRHSNWDILVIEARQGAKPRQITTFDGPDNEPDWESPLAWSPDGRSIAYVQGGPQKLIYYAVQKLAVVPAAGGAARLPAVELDRNVSRPHWTADGRSILFIVEDDRARQLARVPASGGKVERLLTGDRALYGLTVGPGDRIALLAGTADQPFEVHALEGARLRALSNQNEVLLSAVQLGKTEEIQFKSKDGTPISGLIVKPPHYIEGRKYPAVLKIHGGPVAQHEHEFMFEWQLLAAQGYLVVGANPRGSSGRGEAFSTAIYADWGNKDAQDVLAAVDHVVAAGLADPQRLGVGGWSYGGMLTNYVIAQDTRFKAAVSGAGISNILAGYGTDQYIREYEEELGTPWGNTDAWLKVSFPFLHADRIKTPTLFMCGERDFNVPLLNSEQMYQAVRSQGVDTQLVIYPGQYHTIKKPSYKRDRLERYLAWYDRNLMPGPVRVPGETGR